MKKNVLLLLLVLVCTGMLSSCGFNMFPVSDDVKLGSQLDAEIRSNPREYPISTNQEVTNYVQNMANEILQSPQVKYRGRFAYKVAVINDDKTANAFCTPGGYIYVYTGLMKMLDNEASLAGVMGHEIAHAEMRHGTQKMTKIYGLQTMLEMVLGNNPGRTTQMAANLFSGQALLAYGRDNESESDSLSFAYLKTTKWFPGGAKFFFKKLQDGRGTSVVDRMLSTHPLPQDRVTAFDKMIQNAGLKPPTEQNLFAKNYQEFKRKL
jgi:predicted Zn-dependent protease